MPYFWPERVEAFEPQCREIAANLVQSLRERDELEIISTFAQWFAVRSQCAFLGWPPEMCEPLRLWTQNNHQATFAEDRVAMAEIAREFEGYVDQLLQVRRAAGAHASDDITSSLLRQQVGDRPLRDEEIVSVLRNWTVGEVGTISAAVGILVHYISEHPDLQQRLRAQPRSVTRDLTETWCSRRANKFRARPSWGVPPGANPQSTAHSLIGSDRIGSNIFQPRWRTTNCCSQARAKNG